MRHKTVYKIWLCVTVESGELILGKFSSLILIHFFDVKFSMFSYSMLSTFPLHFRVILAAPSSTATIALNSACRCQFHQHFTYAFFVQTSFFYLHVTRKKLPKRDVRTKNSYALKSWDYLGLKYFLKQISLKGDVYYCINHKVSIFDE